MDEFLLPQIQPLIFLLFFNIPYLFSHFLHLLILIFVSTLFTVFLHRLPLIFLNQLFLYSIYLILFILLTFIQHFLCPIFQFFPEVLIFPSFTSPIFLYPAFFVHSLNCFFLIVLFRVIFIFPLLFILIFLLLSIIVFPFLILPFQSTLILLSQSTPILLFQSILILSFQTILIFPTLIFPSQASLSTILVVFFLFLVFTILI